jgi:hypothetical protein
VAVDNPKQNNQDTEGHKMRSLIFLLILVMFLIILWQARPQPQITLKLHYVYKGGIPKACYLEKWKPEDNEISVTDYIIVWPKASKGYIDAMIENSRGQIEHKWEVVK